MYTDDLGRITFSTKDLIKEIYKGNKDKLDKVRVFIDDEDYLKYIEFIRENNLPEWPIPSPEDCRKITKEDFDKQNQSNWFMPDDPRPDLLSLLHDKCTTDEQHARVDLELELFIQHDMLDLLYYLKFMVDTLRENNILWGVGRGSSVASYVLYLIGVHKIDSIKYQLDIKEFLKSEN